MTRKLAMAAAAVAVVNVAVAVMVNLLTAGWSWLIFVALAVLCAAWAGLEAWRAVPKRAPREAAIGTPAVASGFVPRPELTNRIVRALLAGRASKVGITTALAGAGGFGKTTLATAVCELPEIKKAFPSTYWVTVGQEVRGAALADTINDVIERISKQRSGITSPEQAGLELGERLKEQGPSLLVVDDVWTAEQLRPFLNAGRGCTLLVTTRIPTLLTDHADAETVQVDQMSHAQARQLVTGGVPGLPEAVGEQLMEITGRWPIALRLANATLRRTARDGGDVTTAAERLLNRLRDLGPTALDLANEARRERTVAATLESSLGVLGEQRNRVLELAIFPEDTEVPQDLVALLWQATANLSRDDGDRLCHELAELSLVTRHGDRLRVHDVIRAYLRHECGQAQLQRLNNTLLDAVASTLPSSDPVAWWTLPRTAEYLWRALAYHLNDADRGKELATLVTAPHWVITKLRRFGPVTVAEDLAFVSTPRTIRLSRFLDQMGHLLVPGDLEHAVVNALAQRLPDSPAFEDLRKAALAEVERLPRLVPEMAMPDLPDPALNRVLVGHEGRVRGCVFAPDGSWLVSAAWDGLRVWHPDSGQLIRLLPTDSPDALALSPDGSWLACEGDEGTIQLWDTRTWEIRGVLLGHEKWVDSCCYSMDGTTLASSGNDDVLRVWDVGTGKVLRLYAVPETILASAALPDGRLLSIDRKALRVWDLSTGRHTDLVVPTGFLPRDMAISPDRKWAVVPGKSGLAVHDLANLHEPPRTLHHRSGLTTVAFSPTGAMLATGNDRGLVTMWSTADWRPLGEIAAHGSEVSTLAFSPTGEVLASTGDDETVRLWDSALVRGGTTRDKPGSDADSCVVAGNGTWLAIRSSSDVVSVYDTATRADRTLLSHSYPSYSIAAVGSDALAVEQLSGIRISDTADWQMSRTLHHPTDLVLNNMSTGGHLVCAVDEQDRVVVWDVETWQPPVFLEVDESGTHVRQEPPNPFMERIRGGIKRIRKTTTDIDIEVAPGGEWLAVKVGDVVHVVAPRTWEKITTWRLPTDASKPKAGPGGRWLAVHVDRTIHMLNSDTWTVDAELPAPPDARFVRDAAWSPDGSLLATVSDDRTLRVHDGHDWTTRTEIRLDGELKGCAWISNDRLVAVGGHGVYWFTYVPG